MVYDWKNVGTVDGDIINIEAFFASDYAPKARIDECGRKKCDQNWIKIPDTDDQCCWHCIYCGDLKTQISEYECKDCPTGQRSVINDTSQGIQGIICVLINEVIHVNSFVYGLIQPRSIH